MMALIILWICSSSSVDEIDLLRFDLVKYCGASPCCSDNDGSYSLMASFGFRLSNSEKSSCAFSTIGTGGDGNSGLVSNSPLWFAKAGAVRVSVCSCDTTLYSQHKIINSKKNTVI
jgi:hypothetical protein